MATRAMRPPIKITFFGDSTCVGQGVSIYRGWVTQIARSLEEHGQKKGCDILVTNSSINGRTTRQALEDMPYHIQSHAPDILVVQFGLNDCNYWATDKGVPRVSLPAFVANLREIVLRARKFGAFRVFLNSNHPTTRDKNAMEHASITYQASNETYNKAIRELATDIGSYAHLNDIEAHFLKLIASNGRAMADYLLADGLHLSFEGHEEYYRIIGPPILEAVDAFIVANGNH